MTRIAVTGGSGRVGRAVIELALAQGHSVVSIDRVPPAQGTPQPGLTFIEADVTDYAKFEAALQDCEALIHLAAIPAPGYQPDHEVHNNNVVGSYNALRAAAQLGLMRVCQASSVNATGLAYSRAPRYDYFPLDEAHPTYNEDPYSLSKWICEIQADSLVRRYAGFTVSSLRFHWVVQERGQAAHPGAATHPGTIKNLWGYTCSAAAARACLLGIASPFTGHEAFYIVAPDTVADTPSLELKEKFYPDVALRGSLDGRRAFFDCAKAERLLGWRHDDN